LVIFRGDREKCLEAGMNNYLAKPVKAATLKDMLEQYLHQPPVHIPNLQQDAQQITKSAMKDIRRLSLSKPKNWIDTQTAETDTGVSTTDTKQISPKTAIPPRTLNSGLGASRKLLRRSNSENDPGIISQSWRYGSSNRSLNQWEVSSGPDGTPTASETFLDKKTPPPK
jgi:response regulator of citrate/malate metabolism